MHFICSLPIKEGATGHIALIYSLSEWPHLNTWYCLYTHVHGMQRQFLHLTSPNERLEDTIKHWTSMAVVNTVSKYSLYACMCIKTCLCISVSTYYNNCIHAQAIKLTLILLIIQPFVYCVNEQDGLTCLAERLPSSDKTFQECRTLTLVCWQRYHNSYTDTTEFKLIDHT